MTMYIKIGETQYPAERIEKERIDWDWDMRESCYITLEMEHDEALQLFVDDLKWSVILNTEEHEDVDYSDYSVAGDVTDHRNGTVTVQMGKPTAAEIVAALTGE